MGIEGAGQTQDTGSSAPAPPACLMLYEEHFPNAFFPFNSLHILIRKQSAGKIIFKEKYPLIHKSTCKTFNYEFKVSDTGLLRFSISLWVTLGKLYVLRHFPSNLLNFLV